MSNQPTKQARHKPRRLSVHTWVKIAVLSLIVLCTAVLLTIHTVKKQMEQHIENTEQQVLELEQEIGKLHDYISNKNTDDGVKDVAQDELGMVDPDTVIYDFD